MKQTIKVVSILSLVIMCLNVNAQMKVYNTGSISIGSVTSTPNAKLDVFTNTNTYGLIVGNSPSGNNIKISGTAGTGLDYCLLQTFSGGTTAGGSLVFQRDAGNVGIGTTSPTQKLDMGGNIILNYNNLYLKDVNHGLVYSTNFGGSTMDGPALFGYGSGVLGTTGGGNKAVLFWNSSGNVGIGTTSPGSKFEVLGGSGVLVANFQGTASSYFQFKDNTSGQTIYMQPNPSGNPRLGTIGNYGFDIVTNQGPRISILAAGNVGIGTSTPGTYKLYVNGTSYFNNSVSINGNCTRTGTDNFTSDQQFKTNVDSIHSALNTIKQLKPKSFYFDTTNVYGLNFSNRKQYGFIAQDVETILPELITESTKLADYDTSGNVIHPAVTYKSLNYVAFIGILTKGIQELQQKNDSLKVKTTKQDSINTALQNQVFHLITNDSLMQNQLAQLSSLISDCCNSHGNGHDNHRTEQQSTNNNQDQSSTTLTNAELKDGQLIVLKQNVPNPFNQQTTIQYIIPTTTQSASIMVFDLNGKLMKTIPITNYGSNSIIINGNELTPGMFVYSLIVNGKIIDTKRMILTQ